MLDLQLLSRLSHKKVFKKGDIVFNEGDKENREFFVILMGEASVYKNYLTENTLVLPIKKAGDIFGEFGMFCNIPRTTSIVALTDVVVLALSKENYLMTIKSNPEIAFQLSKGICEKLYDANLKVIPDTSNQTIIDTRPKEKIEEAKKEVKVEEKTVNTSKINIDESASDELFIPEHKLYNVNQPESFKNYYTKTKKNCPCCGKETEVSVQLYYKQKPTKVGDSDMRRYIQDFEPLWYNIMTCTHCYFSMFEDGFDNTKHFYVGDLAKKLEKIRESIKIDFSAQKNVDVVFTTYYIALICSKYYDNFKQIQAKIWLELSWLYDIVDDEFVCGIVTEKAYMANRRLYEECKMNTENEQLCNLIIGTLAARLDKLEEAYRYLYDAKKNKDGNPVYRRLADEKIYQLKQEHPREIGEKPPAAKQKKWFGN